MKESEQDANPLHRHWLSLKRRRPVASKVLLAVVTFVLLAVVLLFQFGGVDRYL